MEGIGTLFRLSVNFILRAVIGITEIAMHFQKLSDRFVEILAIYPDIVRAARTMEREVTA